jgi:electron transfer flavoprotein alpha subunit
MNQDIVVLVEHLRGQVADISYVMLGAARALAQGTGGHVVGLLLGHDARGLAADLAADQVWYAEDPALAEFTSDAYLQVLGALLPSRAPRAVLMGDTSIGAEVAGGLSAQLGWPLISYCRSVRADDGALKFTCQICGGRVMAEGDLPGPTALVTMIPGGFKPELGHATQPPPIVDMIVQPPERQRIVLRKYLEPAAGDVDIAKEPLLISVGRGIQQQDNLALAEELAAAMGGVLSASRPVVDQGWIPTTRLVGKSGKRVKPKVYLALGISGAPEHVEAIGDSELIVAVNTDPAAPIFDLAEYGATLDVLELLPALTECVREAKSRA